MSHTPTWGVSVYDGGWTGIRETNHNGQIIAKLGLNSDANAHLLAAAPDLLEALEALVSTIPIPGDWWCPYCGPTECRSDGSCDYCGTPIEDCQPDTTVVDNARAAIARAKGSIHE